MKISLQVAIEKQPPKSNDILRLTDCDVYHINLISPTLSKQFRSLFLSRNFIESLVNIEQFENLITLSLSHNFIRYLDDIQPLSRLQFLKKLSLSGNMVTLMPFYKEHVLTLCPHLKQLDENIINSDDHRLSIQIHSRAKVSYQQLQVDQLRNCLLEHLSALLACHSEMRKFVFGTFRFALQSHIGAETRAFSLTMEGEPTWFPSYMVLRQATQGRVFHWLQLMAAQHFRHSVQNDLYEIKCKWLQNSQKLGGAVDVECVSTLAQRQQHWQNELLNRCSILWKDSGLCTVDSHEGHVDRGIYLLPMLLDAVNQLNFGSHPNAMRLQDESAGQLSLSSEQVSVVRTQATLQAMRPKNSSTKSLQAVHHDLRSGVIPMNAHEMQSAHEVTKIQLVSRKTEIKERYDMLLSQMPAAEETRRPIASRSVASRSSMDCGSQMAKERKVLSRCLPKQQVEPESDGIKTAPVHIVDMVTHIHPSIDFDSVKSQALELQSEDVFLAMANDGVEWNVTLVDEVMFRWNSLADEIDKCSHNSGYYPRNSEVVVGPLALEGDKEPTMRMLNVEVRRLSDALRLLQREETQLRETHNRLTHCVTKLAAANLFTVNFALSMLSDQTKAIDTLRRSTSVAAQQWLPEAMKLLSTGDDKRCLLNECSQRTSSMKEQLVAIRDSNMEQSIVETEQRESISKVCMAMDSLRGQLDSDPTVVATLRTQRIANVASHLSKSLFSNSLRRRVLTAWRRYVRQKRRVIEFQLHCFQQRRVVVLRRILVALKHSSFLSITAKIVSYQLNRKRLRERFGVWRIRFQSSLFEKKLMSVFNAGMVRRALRTWSVTKEKWCQRRDEMKRDNLYVTLFTLVRVFRAWRHVTLSGNVSQVQNVCTVCLIRQSRVFWAWWQLFRVISVQKTNKYHSILALHHKSIVQVHFGCWRSLFLFRQHLLQYKLKKRGVQLWLRFASLQRLQRCAYQCSFAMVTFRLRKVFLYMKKSLRVRRVIRVAADTLSSATLFSFQRRVWSQWLKATNIRRLRQNNICLMIRKSTRQHTLAQSLDCWWKNAFSHSQQVKNEQSNVWNLPSVVTNGDLNELSIRRVPDASCADVNDDWSEDWDSCSVEAEDSSFPLDVFGERTMEYLQWNNERFSSNVRTLQVRLRKVLRLWKRVTDKKRVITSLAARVSALSLFSSLRRAFCSVHFLWLRRQSVSVVNRERYIMEVGSSSNSASLVALQSSRQQIDVIVCDGRTRQKCLQERLCCLQSTLSQTDDCIQNAITSEQDVDASLSAMTASIELCSFKERELYEQCRVLLLGKTTSNDDMAIASSLRHVSSNGPVDERLLLMEDVSDLYSSAVSIQETLLLKREKWHSASQAAIHRVSTCSDMLKVLEELKYDFQQLRINAESELLSISHQLNESISNSLHEASVHQHQSTSLMHELSHLTNEVSRLSDLEECLRLQTQQQTSPVKIVMSTSLERTQMKALVLATDLACVVSSLDAKKYVATGPLVFSEKENIKINTDVSIKVKPRVQGTTTTGSRDQKKCVLVSSCSVQTMRPIKPPTCPTSKSFVAEQIADVSERIRQRLHSKM